MSNVYSTDERDIEADYEEATRLLQIIADENPDNLSSWEQDFLESITEWIESGRDVTVRQLYKLRDLKDKLI